MSEKYVPQPDNVNTKSGIENSTVKLSYSVGALIEVVEILEKELELVLTTSEPSETTAISDKCKSSASTMRNALDLQTERVDSLRSRLSKLVSRLDI